MTGLADLTVEEIREREHAQTRVIRLFAESRGELRAELARRLDKPVEDLFPAPRYRTDRQRQHTDADRALRKLEQRYRELLPFVERCARLEPELGLMDIAALVVDARRLIGERAAA